MPPPGPCLPLDHASPWATPPPGPCLPLGQLQRTSPDPQSGLRARTHACCRQQQEGYLCTPAFAWQHAHARMPKRAQRAAAPSHQAWILDPPSLSSKPGSTKPVIEAWIHQACHESLDPSSRSSKPGSTKPVIETWIHQAGHRNLDPPSRSGAAAEAAPTPPPACERGGGGRRVQGCV